MFKQSLYARVAVYYAPMFIGVIRLSLVFITLQSLQTRLYNQEATIQYLSNTVRQQQVPVVGSSRPPSTVHG